MAKPASSTQQSSSSDAKVEQKEVKNEADSAESGEKKASPTVPAEPVVPTFSAEQTKTIDDIVSMGYPREEVVRACQGSFKNMQN